MNQFNKFRDFVHGNSVLSKSKNDRQILSTEVMKDEKHMENIKSILTTAEKKLSNSLISPRRTLGSDPVAPEKKTKKFPSTSLNKFFNEASEILSLSKNDSVLGKTLLTCSQLQNEFTQILAEHESNIEQNCLNRIEKYLDEDLPSIHRTKKQLTKAYEELKTARSKHDSFTRSAQQSLDIQNKIETLKKDVEYSEHKLEQCQDAYEIEIFDFLGKELTISEIFFQYIKLLEIYHEQMLQQIRHYIPVLEGVLKNTSQRPVFGCPLEEHLRSSGRKISVVIEKCVEYLFPFVREEGLFRISGSLSKVKRMRNAFNAGRLEALSEMKNDAPAVVSTLKSYLRELPEPLLTFRLYPDWIEASKESDQNERLKSIWTVCTKLPEANRNNLCYLMKFLHELTKYSELNKMSSQNLAIALGPSLLWSERDSCDLSMSNHLPTLVEALITYCDYFFPNEFPEFATNSPTSPVQTNMIDNSSSFSDNSDDQDFSLNATKFSPILNHHHHSSNDKINQQLVDKKKKPAPKPPSSMTSSQSSLQTTNIDLSPTGSLTSSSTKIRSKVASFKFQKPSALNKPTLTQQGENITISNSNEFSQNPDPIMKESNREEPLPTAIYLTTKGTVRTDESPGIYLRKSPESMSTFRPQPPIMATTKIRPKSVCERPMVAPPSVPPRPSLTPKQSKVEIGHQNSKSQLSSNDNIQLVDKYPELNHIDSESDDQNSRSSKDLSDHSIQQKVLIDFKDDSKSNIDEQHSSIYPSLEAMMEKNDNENEEEIKIPFEPASTPPPPHRPPRTHSSNSSTGSSSNLSMNDGRDSILDTTSFPSLKKRHQRSASSSISTLNNNNNNPDIDDNSKSNPNSSKITQSKTDHQTYL